METSSSCRGTGTGGLGLRAEVDHDDPWTKYNQVHNINKGSKNYGHVLFFFTLVSFTLVEYEGQNTRIFFFIKNY